MPRLYVVDVPEFRPVVEAAQRNDAYRVSDARKGYWLIESEGEISFNRREMGLKPALWYGIFTGGLDGEIIEWGRETVRIIGTNRPL